MESEPDLSPADQQLVEIRGNEDVIVSVDMILGDELLGDADRMVDVRLVFEGDQRERRAARFADLQSNRQRCFLTECCPRVPLPFDILEEHITRLSLDTDELLVLISARSVWRRTTFSRRTSSPCIAHRKKFRMLSKMVFSLDKPRSFIVLCTRSLESSHCESISMCCSTQSKGIFKIRCSTTKRLS